MIETHPFGNFIPKDCHYLFLGTFTGKITDPSYDWFFGTKRNQFWSILENVYKIELKNKSAKQILFNNLQMAITDIILECERNENTNADNNLINIVYNTTAITNIVLKNNIKSIYFSSRMAEKLFKKNFITIIQNNPGISLITLPSSSPRYATISKQEKINKYIELLPRLVKS